MKSLGSRYKTDALFHAIPNYIMEHIATGCYKTQMCLESG